MSDPGHLQNTVLSLRNISWFKKWNNFYPKIALKLLSVESLYKSYISRKDEDYILKDLC